MEQFLRIIESSLTFIFVPDPWLQHNGRARCGCGSRTPVKVGRRKAERWSRHVDGLQWAKVSHRRQKRPHIPRPHRAAD